MNAARAAARRNGALNQIRQLSLGLLNHEAATQRFPSAGGDAESRPNLSWRVHILPYLEEQGLYEQFRLNEPWDSEHNIQLVEQMPQIYVSPTMESPPGHTHFQLVVGEETAFNGGRGPRLRDFTDGLSHTAMLVEADSTVIWTKPDDWEYDPEEPFRDLGHMHVGRVFLACFADGHVQAISIDSNWDAVKAIFTHNAGDRVRLDRF